MEIEFVRYNSTRIVGKFPSNYFKQVGNEKVGLEVRAGEFYVYVYSIYLLL